MINLKNFLKEFLLMVLIGAIFFLILVYFYQVSFPKTP